MNRDRWQKVEQLYRATLERDSSERAAFLDKACEGDDEVHHEVECLLGDPSTAERSLGAAAMPVGVEMIEDAQQSMLTGRRMGVYQVQARIGAGGMGEVYHARDTRLDREVAIKVLPAHLARSPEFKQRFEREAKAISQLTRSEERRVGKECRL